MYALSAFRVSALSTPPSECLYVVNTTIELRQHRCLYLTCVPLHNSANAVVIVVVVADQYLVHETYDEIIVTFKDREYFNVFRAALLTRYPSLHSDRQTDRRERDRKY